MRKEETLKELSTLIDKLERTETVQDRIQFLVDCVGNPNALAKITDLSVSGLKRYLQGGEPTASKIMQIANSLHVNPAWLLTGKGFIYSDESGYVTNERAIALLTQRRDFIEVLNEQGKNNSKEIVDVYSRLKSALSSYRPEVQEMVASCVIEGTKGKDKEIIEAIIADFKNAVNEDIVLIPGYDIQVSAGHGSLNGDVLQPIKHIPFRRSWLKDRGFNLKDLAIFWAKGDSMDTTISDGDTLVINKERTELHDGNIYVFRHGDEHFVKRYQRMIGVWRLVSDNKAYTVIDIKKEEQHQLDVIGEVVHIQKDVVK